MQLAIFLYLIFYDVYICTFGIEIFNLGKLKDVNITLSIVFIVLQYTETGCSCNAMDSVEINTRVSKINKFTLFIIFLFVNLKNSELFSV